MAMLIYADEAKANIITFATECGSTVLPIDAILMILNQIDTVDAVEVVRCRECKSYDEECGYCESMGFTCKFDDFCSYGGKRINGKAD